MRQVKECERERDAANKRENLTTGQPFSNLHKEDERQDVRFLRFFLTALPFTFSHFNKNKITTDETSSQAPFSI